MEILVVFLGFCGVVFGATELYEYSKEHAQHEKRIESVQEQERHYND